DGPRGRIGGTAAEVIRGEETLLRPSCRELLETRVGECGPVRDRDRDRDDRRVPAALRPRIPHRTGDRTGRGGVPETVGGARGERAGAGPVVEVGADGRQGVAVE